MAFAGKTASVDIPKLRDSNYPSGRDSFAAVAAKPSKQHGMLPTPPNSISPNLPAHHFKPDGHHSNNCPAPLLHRIESDIDLQDAVEHAKSQDHPPHSLSAEALDSLGDLDSAGAITPALLAKHHLPNVLLLNGPLAIRHIMGYLTTSVPGFSRIAGAKARRLVVAALEGRGSGGEGGGLVGDVEFEKVGWGRWDARKRGQPSRESQRLNGSPDAQPGVAIPQPREAFHASSVKLGTSHADSAVFSHSEMDYGETEDVTMHDADKMSLDGDDFGYASSSPAPDDPNLDDDVAGDVTDEEDWASIGAEALRARSLPSSAAPLPRHLYQPVPIPIYSKASARSRSRGRGTPSTFARSIPKSCLSLNNFTPMGLPSGVGGTQERDAIQALMSLGAM